MTAPGETKGKAAAAGFVAFLGLMFGGVGLVVAALAVGAERTWAGWRGKAPYREQARRDAVADAREWLAHDARQRSAWRQARRHWWADGADPASKPPMPPAWTRVGDWVRRQHARGRVARADFRDGWRDGWQAADLVRRDGGGFRDVAAARPQVSRDPDPSEAADGLGRQVDPLGLAGRRDTAGPSSGDPQARFPTDPVHQSDDPSGAVAQRDARDGADTARDAGLPADERPFPAQIDNAQDSNNNGGKAMSAPSGESNAAVLAAKLSQINATTTQVSELVDQLAAIRGQLDAQVTDATEFAEATGQSAQTRAALDSAQAVSQQLGQHVGSVSEAAEQAVEDTGAAREGLRPVEQAEDALRQAGADGRAVAPATAA